jgi:hypothetical protein
MDLIFIFTTPMCNYQYDPELLARTQFITDRRLHPCLWTRSERRHYDEMRARYEKSINYFVCMPQWYESVFEEVRAREPDKTLVEIYAKGAVPFGVVDEQVKRGYYEKRGDRLLCVSFFHNDDETLDLTLNLTPEKVLEAKAGWIEDIMRHPYAKLVEIPFDFTLTDEYLRGLFDQYVLN